MILRTLIIMLGCCLCSLALAQEPKARTSISTKGDLWTGQRVTLVVELLAPGYFSGTPSFDLPDTPGILIIPPAGSPVVSSETIDGVSYTVQRYEVAIFARHAGEQTVPGMPIRIHFKRAPLDKDTVAAEVKSAPVTFTAKAPQGAEKLGNIISARDLKAEEVWKPEPGKAKAGEAFIRTITYTAPDVPAMAFPPFPTDRIDGLGIYAKPPEVLDHSERGSLTGKRRDTITYVCQRPGHFTIPAAKLTWFDLEAKKLQTIHFPAVTLEVAPNPAMASAAAAKEAGFADQRPTLAWLVGALAASLLGVLVWKTHRLWQPVLDLFRPVYLAPLNPTNRVCRIPSSLIPNHPSTPLQPQKGT